MRIAVASGKGGTGKTTVATNLALRASRSGRTVAYLDCDVEEPNGHIFLKPELSERTPVGEPVPQVDVKKCTLCGCCGEICQYSAIVLVGSSVLVYPELCHACGGCTLVCPEDAITEVSREIGFVETGRAGPIQFVHGVLHVGQARAVPLIKAVKAVPLEVDLAVLDVPPGTSCPVVEAVRGADFVILVTEPTPFGLHDLKLAAETMRALGLPCGVVINRATIAGAPVAPYCQARRIPILAELPDDRRLAEAYSRGEMACDVLPGYEATFLRLLDAAVREAGTQRRAVG